MKRVTPIGSPVTVGPEAMRLLDPDIASTLEAKGATPEEKDALLGFILNQAASARGRVAGLRNSASDLSRQADEAETQAAALEAMVEKFTDEAALTE